MQTPVMGKVLVPVRIENLEDVFSARKGLLPADQVRFIEVADALVDTGATFLALPRRLILQLGLELFRTRKAKTSAGVAEFGMYSMARLSVQGRDCHVEVAELPDDCPVLIGQIPLESLDFIVDPIKQRLLGNPDHGGEHMMELFGLH